MQLLSDSVKTCIFYYKNKMLRYIAQLLLPWPTLIFVSRPFSQFSENLLRKARGGNSTINAASIVHDTTGTDGEYIDLANNDGNNHSGYLDIGGQDGANTNNNMVQGSYVGVRAHRRCTHARTHAQSKPRIALTLRIAFIFPLNSPAPPLIFIILPHPFTRLCVHARRRKARSIRCKCPLPTL